MIPKKGKGVSYGPVCEGCAAKHGPLWQITMSNLLPEPCLFCGVLTKDLHEFEKVPDFRGMGLLSEEEK